MPSIISSIKYGSAYSDIANAVAAAQIDDKHFVFQLPDRTIDGAGQKKQAIEAGRTILSAEKDLDALRAEISPMTFKARDYIYVTLGDNEASQEVPKSWYDQDLGGHLIVGGPAVAPKSTNISNGTPSASSTGRNNNTKEEMEAAMKEEKNKSF